MKIERNRNRKMPFIYPDRRKASRKHFDGLPAMIILQRHQTHSRAILMRLSGIRTLLWDNRNSDLEESRFELHLFRAMKKQKPLTIIEQYKDFKLDCPPDTFLVWRFGDFYETFFEDAIEVSAILELALTRRGKILMCGFPYHVRDRYFEKLLKRKNVVLSDTEPEKGKKGSYVRRVDVIKTIDDLMGF